MESRASISRYGWVFILSWQLAMGCRNEPRTDEVPIDAVLASHAGNVLIREAAMRVVAPAQQVWIPLVFQQTFAPTSGFEEVEDRAHEASEGVSAYQVEKAGAIDLPDELVIHGVRVVARVSPSGTGGEATLPSETDHLGRFEVPVKLRWDTREGESGTIEVKGTAWREYLLTFPRELRPGRAAQLRVSVEQGGRPVEFRSVSARVSSAAYPARAATGAYPIQFTDKTAYLFMGGGPDGGGSYRYAYPLNPSQRIRCLISSRTNLEPTIWAAARCRRTGSRIRFSAVDNAGVRRGLGVMSFDAMVSAGGAQTEYIPVPLDLRAPGLRGQWLEIAFECDEGEPPLAPAPLALISLTDLHPMAESPGSMPNIVLVSLDTLRADHLTCYGGPTGISPVLDGLAAEGSLFEECIAATPWTLPSHRTILTGRLPYELGLYHKLAGCNGESAGPHGGAFPYGMPVDGIESLAAALYARGYETVAITDGGYLSARYGCMDGFEGYIEPPAQDAAGTMELAARYLRNRGSKRPFFLFVHSYQIHAPYNRTEYLRSSGLLAQGTVEELEGRITSQPSRTIAGLMGILKDMDLVRLDVARALYLGGIQYSDKACGILFDAIKAAGVWNDSLIVVLSDHGEEFGDRELPRPRLYDAHGHTLHREVLSVPLIVKWPGGRYAGQRVSVPVHHLDIAPTLLWGAGIVPSKSLAGLDLAEVARGRLAPERPLFSESVVNNFPEMKSLRWGRYKAVGIPLGVPQLYDCVEDPWERRPLPPSDVPESARVLDGLREYTLESLSGEMIFCYKGQEPIRSFDLQIRHAVPPVAVIPYVGVGPNHLVCTPDATVARLPDDLARSPEQVLFGIWPSGESAMEVTLEVDNAVVSPSTWRVGTKRGVRTPFVKPVDTLISGSARRSFSPPTPGEFSIFTLGSLDERRTELAADVVDAEHLEKLRALGYIGD